MESDTVIVRLILSTGARGTSTLWDHMWNTKNAAGNIQALYAAVPMLKWGDVVEVVQTLREGAFLRDHHRRSVQAESNNEKAPTLKMSPFIEAPDDVYITYGVFSFSMDKTAAEVMFNKATPNPMNCLDSMHLVNEHLTCQWSGVPIGSGFRAILHNWSPNGVLCRTVTNGKVFIRHRLDNRGQAIVPLPVPFRDSVKVARDASFTEGRIKPAQNAKRGPNTKRAGKKDTKPPVQRQSVDPTNAEAAIERLRRRIISRFGDGMHIFDAAAYTDNGSLADGVVLEVLPALRWTGGIIQDPQEFVSRTAGSHSDLTGRTHDWEFAVLVNNAFTKWDNQDAVSNFNWTSDPITDALFEIGQSPTATAQCMANANARQDRQLDISRYHGIVELEDEESYNRMKRSERLRDGIDPVIPESFPRERLVPWMFLKKRPNGRLAPDRTTYTRVRIRVLLVSIVNIVSDLNFSRRDVLCTLVEFTIRQVPLYAHSRGFEMAHIFTSAGLKLQNTEARILECWWGSGDRLAVHPRQKTTAPFIRMPVPIVSSSHHERPSPHAVAMIFNLRSDRAETDAEAGQLTGWPRVRHGFTTTGQSRHLCTLSSPSSIIAMNSQNSHADMVAQQLGDAENLTQLQAEDIVHTFGFDIA